MFGDFTYWPTLLVASTVRVGCSTAHTSELLVVYQSMSKFPDSRPTLGQRWQFSLGQRWQHKLGPTSFCSLANYNPTLGQNWANVVFVLGQRCPNAAQHKLLCAICVFFGVNVGPMLYCPVILLAKTVVQIGSCAAIVT